MKHFTPIIILASLCLSACSTPLTVMRNPQTGHVTRCGGTTTGSLTGGMIGHKIAEGMAEDCVERHKANGYEVETYIED